jgi:hypothetical protein
LSSIGSPPSNGSVVLRPDPSSRRKAPLRRNARSPEETNPFLEFDLNRIGKPAGPAIPSKQPGTPGRFAIQLMSDSRERYNLVELDEKMRTLVISKRHDPNWKTTLVYRRPQPDVLFVEGPFDGHEVRARLRLAEPPEFLLVTRGFHWINERPFNR